MPVLHEWDQRLLDLFKDMPTDSRMFNSKDSPTGEEYVEVVAGEIFTGRVSFRFSSAGDAFNAYADFVSGMLDKTKKLYWRIKPELSLFEAYDGPCLACSRFAPINDECRSKEVNGRILYENPKGCSDCGNTGWVTKLDTYNIYSRFLISDKPPIYDVLFDGDSEVASNG